MHILVNQQLADQQNKLRLRAAEEYIQMCDQSLEWTKAAKGVRWADLWRLWYRLYDLAVPLYDLEDVGKTRKLLYDWLRERTKLIIRTVGLLAFAVGILLGSLLSSIVNISLVLGIAVISLFIACSSLLFRSLTFGKSS